MNETNAEEEVVVVKKKWSHKVELEPGTYLWCACGKSATKPFCDDSHLGTDIEPVSFEITEKKIYSLCGCYKTLTAPICDGTHKTIVELEV